MVKGWNHFSRVPGIVDADRIFWNRYLYRNLEKIVRILVILTDESSCIVCGKYSMNYSNRSNLAFHIQDHSKKTINYWLNIVTCKSPDDLESILNYDELGNSKHYEVVDF